MPPKPIMTWYNELIVSVCPSGVGVALGWATLLAALFLTAAEELELVLEEETWDEGGALELVAFEEVELGGGGGGEEVEVVVGGL
jgi:hypothetical protein